MIIETLLHCSDNRTSAYNVNLLQQYTVVKTWVLEAGAWVSWTGLESYWRDGKSQATERVVLLCVQMAVTLKDAVHLHMSYGIIG